MNKLALFLSALALILSGFVYKLSLDQYKVNEEIYSSIKNNTTMITNTTNKIEALIELKQAMGNKEAGAEATATEEKKNIILRMIEGYYCMIEVKGENSTIWFDGINRVKTWGDADGTREFMNSNDPDGVGKYSMVGNQIVMQIQNRVVNKEKVNRTAKALSWDEDGFVLEFEAYGFVYSNSGCPFNRK